MGGPGSHKLAGERPAGGRDCPLEMSTQKNLRVYIRERSSGEVEHTEELEL